MQTSESSDNWFGAVSRRRKRDVSLYDLTIVFGTIVNPTTSTSDPATLQLVVSPAHLALISCLHPAQSFIHRACAYDVIGPVSSVE